MKRILMFYGLLIVFIGWIFYRLFIKKDLKKHLDTLYLGLVFIALWGLIYYFTTK